MPIRIFRGNQVCDVKKFNFVIPIPADSRIIRVKVYFPMRPYLCPLLLLAVELSAQPIASRSLELNQTLTAGFTSSAPHSYTLTLSAGQYARVVISRPTFSTVVGLKGPGSPAKLLELHWPVAPQTSEPVQWIAKKPGLYQIELAPSLALVEGASYSIALIELRPSVAADSKQLDVQRLFESARVHDLKAEYQQAAAAWARAVNGARNLLDREREAAALNGIATTNLSLAQYEKSASYFEQALAIYRELKDSIGEGRALRSIGANYLNLAQIEKATDYLEKASSIAREAKDRNGEGRALTSLAQAAGNLGQYEKAINLNQQAAAIMLETRDRITEGRILNSMAGSNLKLGHYDEAILLYEQAVAIAREVKEGRDEGNALTGLGLVFLDRAQYDKALSYLDRTLAIRREGKDLRGEGNVLSNLGIVYRELSLYEKAVDHFQKAVRILHETKVRSLEANALMNLAGCYQKLSRPDKAVTFYEQALAIAREIKNPREEAYALNNLGQAHVEMRQYDKAVINHQRALVIARELKDPLGEANALNFLGIASTQLRQYTNASTYFDQSIAKYRHLKIRGGEGSALANLGIVHANQGEHLKALGHFEKALVIAREVKERHLEAISLTRLMDSWKSMGMSRLGVFYGKQAVNTIQSVRSINRGLDKELQQSFLKGNEEPYHKLAELLITLGRLTEAEQVLALLKEQEYFEYVRGESIDGPPLDRRAEPTAEEADWEKRYREVGDKLVAIGVERSGLLGNKTPTAEQTSRIAQLEADLSVGGLAFEKFLQDLSKQFAGRPEAAVKLEQIREAGGMMSDLAELPAGAVAIYTLIGESKFISILVTPDTQKSFEYPIKAADLNRKVLALRQVIRNPKLDPRPIAHELYKILIGNMANDLQQANAKTIMWSLDGTLRYLPLAALYDGERYLVEKYALTVFTPASNARLKDPPTTGWKVAAFGVTKAFEGAPALPSVAFEMNSIVMRPSNNDGVLAGELLMDDAFTQTSMKSTLTKHYPVVHIASHFKFSPGNDDSSFLLIGDGSHLSVSALKTLPNIFSGVQMLTLSACNTGVGDVPGEGKEVEAFGVVAQRKGAKSVIASLWPVADASTSLLMREMYRIRESAGVTKVEALRQAQIGLLRGTAAALPGSGAQRALIHEDPPSAQKVEAPVFHTKKEAPYAHPYFWAPFFLMGNWL